MASRYMLSTCMGFCGVYVNSFIMDEEVTIRNTPVKCLRANSFRNGACWSNLGSLTSFLKLYILQVVFDLYIECLVAHTPSLWMSFVALTNILMSNTNIPTYNKRRRRYMVLQQMGRGSLLLEQRWSA